ncbi:agmatinase [Methylovirgula ligni]|nr:agmatinase [Methylovirgula ligni]
MDLRGGGRRLPLRACAGNADVTEPTFSLPPTFLGVRNTARDARLCIAGIPLDIGTTNRSGARDGPVAIRRASRMLVDGAHPHRWIDPVADLDPADIGNFAIALGDLAASLALIERQAAPLAHLVALGGEHTITLPLLRALAKKRGAVGLVHFDAHIDTWKDNFGETYGHGSVFFHAIAEGVVDPRRMVQIGIRSPVQKEIFDWTLAQGVTIITAQDAHLRTPGDIATTIRSVVGEAPAYLSFDIDALDPAFAPGTGTPEVGGLATWQAQAILRQLEAIDFIGMDVVEVAPAYDTAEITALAAATMVWEYLALIAPAP